VLPRQVCNWSRTHDFAKGVLLQSTPVLSCCNRKSSSLTRGSCLILDTSILMFQGINSCGTNAGAAAAAAPTAVASPSGRNAADEAAERLDALMEVLFGHLGRRAAAGELPAAWGTLLAAFEAHLLAVPRSKFTQYALWFLADKARPGLGQVSIELKSQLLLVLFFFPTVKLSSCPPLLCCRAYCLLALSGEVMLQADCCCKQAASVLEVCP